MEIFIKLRNFKNITAKKPGDSLNDATTTKKRKHNKLVTFQDEDSLNTIYELENFGCDDETLTNVWYNGDEFFDLKHADLKMQISLRNLSSAQLRKYNTDELFGLEHYLAKEAMQAEQRRKDSLGIVKSMQILFHKLEKDGSESIARAHQQVSAPAIESARRRGTNNERFVMNQRTKDTKAKTGAAGYSVKRSTHCSRRGKRSAGRIVISMTRPVFSPAVAFAV